MLFGRFDRWMLRFWMLRPLDAALLDASILTPTNDHEQLLTLAQQVQKQLAPLTRRDFLIEDLFDYMMHAGNAQIAKIGHRNPAQSIPPDHLRWPQGGINNL